MHGMCSPNGLSPKARVNKHPNPTTRQSATTGRDADVVIDPSVSLPSHPQDNVVEILVTAEEAALLYHPRGWRMMLTLPLSSQISVPPL